MEIERLLGEIGVFSYDLMPRGWQACDGQLLLKTQNAALFEILGNLYGGDGQKNFALPDLRGRMPVHAGRGIKLGENGGEEKHALTAGEMPAHTHQAFGSASTADAGVPTGNLWAGHSGQNPFSAQSNTAMANQSLSFTGEGEGHDNMSPYVALSYGICVAGVFGGRNGTLGEIIMYAGEHTDALHKEWLPCEGQIIQLAKNTALFSLIGTQYGGDGQKNFALPDLRGAAAIQCGHGSGLTDRRLGSSGGSAAVTLTSDQMAEHTHQAVATATAATTNEPANNIWATGGQVRGGVPLYAGGDSTATAMNNAALNNAGGGKPHNNMPPYLGITFMICVEGKYPTRP